MDTKLMHQMKRRIKKSTRDLAVGDVYYNSDTDRRANVILAQGPKYYTFYDTCHEVITEEHRDDVWVDLMTNELARRAVVCKHWKWMPGMAVVFPEPTGGCDAVVYKQVVRLSEGEGDIDRYRAVCHPYDVPAGCVPFLEDPATLGCLLSLVREVWGGDHIVVLGGFRSVVVYSGEEAFDAWAEGDLCCPAWDSSEIYGEAEALVAALEAAP